jgi:hypothetical protein
VKESNDDHNFTSTQYPQQTTLSLKSPKHYYTQLRASDYRRRHRPLKRSPITPTNHPERFFYTRLRLNHCSHNRGFASYIKTTDYD